MSFLWAILIGAVVGFIARLLSPAPNNPQGFLLTVVLGIVGGEVATFIGRAIGWYRAGQGAGLIASVIGAIIVLAIWRMEIRNRYRDDYSQRV